MSVLSIIAICWVTLNAAIFTALLLRRPRPELRHRLFRWVFQGASKVRPAFSAFARLEHDPEKHAPKARFGATT